MDVRVVNQSLAQIGRVNWQKAICMWMRGRVEIMEDARDHCVYRAPTMVIHRPITVKVLEFTVPKNMRHFKRLTKKSLFERDNGRCVYCGQKLTLKNMTMDHIIPKSKGGRDRWENVVASCQSCNAKKGDRLLEETGMKLHSKPYVPKVNEWFPGFTRGEVWMPEELNVSTTYPIFRD